MHRRNLITFLIAALPFLIVGWIWFSPLAFVPVPWPDDSAFYFVGREFWKWPPRWVMLPQAPFEPTYRIFNFNTMPLYPMLIGLGRFIGIDGSFAIKIWPLGAFAASAAVLGAWLYRAGLPLAGAILISMIFALDPGLRWGAVLVRPESLIALIGMVLVLGLSFGFPKRLQARGFWDPVAALLALGAYAHFNAVHLLFTVVFTLFFAEGWQDWKKGVERLFEIGVHTLVYLTPWLLLVAWHPGLFWQQFQVQWRRLAFPNSWLKTPQNALQGIYQDMGSPEPWPAILHWASYVIWALIFVALIFGLILPVLRGTRHPRQPGTPSLVPATGWVVGSIWLWQTKPEAWFNYYVHVSVWAFLGIASLVAWKRVQNTRFQLTWAPAGSFLCALVLLFGYVNITQAKRLGASQSWHWQTYHEFVDCIDERLTQQEQRLGHPQPFRAWCPTFPDVTIELSRRHPEWELTRTNDFWDRAHLAVQHGRDVEAVVVTETINWTERRISAPASEHPEVHSIWMEWNSHFLNQLWREAGWKPNRYICQRGRWTAFIFEN